MKKYRLAIWMYLVVVISGCEQENGDSQYEQNSLAGYEISSSQCNDGNDNDGCSVQQC